MAHIETINVTQNRGETTSAGLVAIGVYEDKSLTDLGQALDEAGDSVLSMAIDLGDVKGKSGETNMFYINGQRILLIGLGKKDKFNASGVRLAAGKASRVAISKKVDSVAVECFCSGLDSCQAMGEGLVLGSYQFLDYKTKDEENFELKSTTVIGCNHDEIMKGTAIGKAVCFARDLANHPGNVTTPSRLAEEAGEIAKEGGMKLTVFDRKEITAMGMGALAGVA